MLMNVVDPEQIRVAITGPNGLEDLYIEKAGAHFAHGNIYKGKIQNVEPSLQAAFVDIGGEKNGFLHVGDVIPPHGGYDDILKRRKRKAKEGRQDIGDMLYKGQEVLVQISRESLAHKGPSVTTYVSIPGRYLVLMPAVAKRGVSKKITDEHERQELKRALDQITPNRDVGYIIRTAGMGRGKEELQGDLDMLTRLWDAIKESAKTAKAPALLYQETNLVIRAIRDFVYDDVEEIVVDSADAYERAEMFLTAVMPEFAAKLRLYEQREPLFHHYGVEQAIEGTFDRSVRLPSGGEIVIEQTEALVAIDVNTGRFRKGETNRDVILAMNREAAGEIARQLRLRDLGGLVMLDFIDMEDPRDRREVEEVFRQAIKRDRARTTVLPISNLGVMEMTRQRLRQSLKKTLYSPCPSCGGTGVVKGAESLALEAINQIRAKLDGKTGRLAAVMHPRTALMVANVKRAALAELERESGSAIVIEANPSLMFSEMRFEWREPNSSGHAR